MASSMLAECKLEVAMDTDRSKRSVLFLRCPEDLRERLAAAAKRSLRSLNSEAVYRLQKSLKQTTADEAAA
jgi:predicted HicB family RNase H-like nuclease